MKQSLELVLCIEFVINQISFLMCVGIEFSTTRLLKDREAVQIF